MDRKIIWSAKPLPSIAVLITTGVSVGTYSMGFFPFYIHLPDFLQNSLNLVSVFWPIFFLTYILTMLPVRFLLYENGTLEHRGLFKKSSYPIQHEAKYTCFENLFLGSNLHFNNHASTMLYSLRKKDLEEVMPLIDQFLESNGPKVSEEVWTVEPLPPLNILGSAAGFSFLLTIGLMVSPTLRSISILNICPFIFLGLVIHLVNHQFYTAYTLFGNGTLLKRTLFSKVFYQLQENIQISQHLSLVGSKHIQFGDGRQMKMDYIPEFDEVCKSLNNFHSQLVG